MTKDKATLLIFLVIISLAAFFMFWPGPSSEDAWIQNERGIWVKRGDPAQTPPEVLKQKGLLEGAKALFEQYRQTGQGLSRGPCLGLLQEDWVVDIAREPREAWDDGPANQCAQYRQGQASHFIELSPEGEVIRVQ